MPPTPDFTDSELHVIRELLTQRYKKDVEIKLSDCELVLDKNPDLVSKCSTVFWHENGANFVISKIGHLQYRPQFFYTPHDQFGTDIDKYNNLEECITAILQAQSDRQREKDQSHSDLVGKS